MNDIDSVLNYWFGDSKDDAATAKTQAALWWSKNSDIDIEIRQSFENLVLEAEAGALKHWTATPRGRLALIILLDQFPRNMYRDTPASFRFDALARKLCLDGLAAEDDSRLRPVQRLFFYLPLEHAEDRALQQRTVDLLEAVRADVDAALKPVFSGFIDFSRRHQAIIERFGRFPHRNIILGRESTAQEVEFLRQPGSSF